jgi:hypothetical protein
VFHFYFKLQFQIAFSVFRVGPCTRKRRQQVPLCCWYLSTVLQLLVEHNWNTGNESVEAHWKGKEGDIFLWWCQNAPNDLETCLILWIFQYNCNLPHFISSLVQSRSCLVIPCLFWDIPFYLLSEVVYCKKLKLNSMALVRERTIPTERPPPVGEVSANFCE